MSKLDCDWIRVDGESMRPMLRSGDWIGVEWRSRERPAAMRAGDIVLGRGPDEVWLVHRLVHQERWEDGRAMVVLKGDASTQFEVLSPEEIWGRVVAIRRARRARPARMRTGALDRFIAFFSRLRFRRVVFALGWIRRRLP